MNKEMMVTMVLPETWPFMKKIIQEGNIPNCKITPENWTTDRNPITLIFDTPLDKEQFVKKYKHLTKILAEALRTKVLLDLLNEYKQDDFDQWRCIPPDF